MRKRNKVKQTPEDIVFTAVVYVFLTLIGIICLYPLLYVISMSISDPIRIAVEPVLLLPHGFSLDAMGLLFKNQQIWRAYGNTILYTVGGTVINIVMTVLLAYPLSVKKFAGRRVVTALVTFTMLFSGGMVPSYILINKIGLYNSRWAMVLPVAISVFNTIICRTSFEALPEELAESAKIDGANDITILFRIILPVSKAVLSTLVIYYAVAHWNSYMSALLYLPDSTKHPLQMFLVKVLINNDSSMTSGIEQGVDKLFIGDQLKYCSIVVATIPILCVYPFFQKHFTQGVMVGSVKG